MRSRSILSATIAILIKPNNTLDDNLLPYSEIEKEMDSSLLLTSEEQAIDDNVGGGAINEKTRHYHPSDSVIGSDLGKNIVCDGWNPTEHLSHMLHALVGLDRYPQYLGRFRNLSDIDLLANALETRLSDVRRHRTEIGQRRKGIQKLIAKLTSGVIDDDDDDCDCSALWSGHPLLSPPKTWTELRERNILTDHAFKVAHLSAASTTKKARNAKSSKSDRAGTNVRNQEM